VSSGLAAIEFKTAPHLCRPSRRSGARASDRASARSEAFIIIYDKIRRRKRRKRKERKEEGRGRESDPPEAPGWPVLARKILN